MRHIYPLNDLIKHDTDGSDCICGPRIFKCAEEKIMIHHSLDGREINNPNESQPSHN